MGTEEENNKITPEEIVEEVQEDSTIEETTEEADPLVKENDELRDNLLRTKADFDNFMKRTEKDKVQLKDYYMVKAIERFLPLVDSLDQAIKNNPEDEGIKTLCDQMNSILASFNVRSIEAVDKCFDVAYHEVLMEQPDEKPKGVIVAEVQKGYFIGDKILRHAKVIVSKGKE